LIFFKLATIVHSVWGSAQLAKDDHIGSSDGIE